MDWSLIIILRNKGTLPNWFFVIKKRYGRILEWILIGHGCLIVGGECRTDTKVLSKKNPKKRRD